MICDHLRGVSRTNILHLNCFDDRLHKLRENGPGIISEAYYSLFPGKKGTEKVYFFFDEIQSIQGWENFVERLMRTEICEIYITGSSARMLSKEIATSMRGRSLSWEMFPFSFKEFLTAKNVDSNLPASVKKRLLIQQTFEEFWISGGFPEVFGLQESMRVKIHQEYFQAILFRDIIERHDISHPQAFRDMTYKLIDNIGSFYTINTLYGYLKSLGHKIQKASVTQYLEWLEDTFFLFSIRLYDASVSRSRSNPKKIYCIDHAMINSLSSGILVNSGHLLENLVFTALRRKYSKIYYYKTSTGKEVDFIVLLEKREKMLVQVCKSMAEEKTRKREISALTGTMKELDLLKGIIVTWNESETVLPENGSIRVIPVWQFLLECDNRVL